MDDDDEGESRPGTGNLRERFAKAGAAVETKNRESLVEQYNKMKQRRLAPVERRKDLHSKDRIDPRLVHSRGIHGNALPRLIDKSEIDFFVKERPSILPQMVPDPESACMCTDEQYAQWTVSALATDKSCIRCPSCGSRHYNPSLADLYRFCQRCCYVLREPAALRDGGWHRRKQVRQVNAEGLGAKLDKMESAKTARSAQAKVKLRPPLTILCASYGHPDEPRLAHNVHGILADIVGESRTLTISKGQDLRKFFNSDPCPGTIKTLLIRYESVPGQIHAASRRYRGEVRLMEEREGFLAEEFSINVPVHDPTLLIHKANYGHPCGSTRGRGSFDVKEVVQSRVDATGGSFLHIGHTEDLNKVFSDPSRGKVKDLMIDYEVCGVRGEEHEYEINDHLLANVRIEARPQIAPLLIINDAQYGVTKEGIENKVRELNIEIGQIKYSKKQQEMGIAVSREDRMKMKNLPELEDKRDGLLSAPISSVNVRELLQRRVESDGMGAALFFMGRKRGGRQTGRTLITPDDLNEVLAVNPLPNRPKQLTIDYTIPGHDSEHTTNSNEITASGFMRNYIGTNQARIVLEVDDDEHGRAILDEDLDLWAPKVMPVLEISRATYGHPTNISKVFDVTNEVIALCQQTGGQAIYISKDLQLSTVFKDPCRGIRKKLCIEYKVRGYTGSIRLPVSSGRVGTMNCDIDVGYPPQRIKDETERKNTAIVHKKRAEISRRMSTIMKRTQSAEPMKKLSKQVILSKPTQVIAIGGGRRINRKASMKVPRRGLPTIKESHDTY